MTSGEAWAAGVTSAIVLGVWLFIGFRIWRWGRKYDAEKRDRG